MTDFRVRCDPEGLLGVITEVTVKLLPVQEKAQVIMAAFDTVQQAGDAVAAVISQGIIPAGLEMMDSHAIRAAEDFVHAGYPVDAKALLLCEVDGTLQEVQETIDKVNRIFDQEGATTTRVSAEGKTHFQPWVGFHLIIIAWTGRYPEDSWPTYCPRWRKCPCTLGCALRMSSTRVMVICIP